MAPTIERLTEGSTLAEGPHWDTQSQTLYFVDIVLHILHKYDPTTQTHTQVSLGSNMSSFVIPLQGKKDHFVMSFNNTISVIYWDGTSDTYEVVEKIVETTQTFNDGKADSTGRVWAGTHNMNLEDLETSPATGFLYSLGPNKKFTARVEKIKLTNGITFNDKLKKLYYVDSLKYAVHQYDFDVKTGATSNEQEFFSFKKMNIPGLPDGITIDAEGNIWVAVFDGGRIIKIDGQKPNTLLDTIEIPTPQVTSVAFGGKNLDELYVTSGALERNGEKPPLPNGGATFKVTGLGVKGVPMHNAVV